MYTVNAENIDSVFETMFQESNKTMRKVEVLQDYSVIDNSPSLQAWVAGDKSESIRLAGLDTGIIEWRQAAVASRAQIQRIHVVSRPFTVYLEWEVEVIYKNSLIEYGVEQVQLVNVQDVTRVLPHGDFWIFDDIKVLEFIYTPEGLVSGAHVYEDEEASRHVAIWRHLERLAYAV